MEAFSPKESSILSSPYSSPNLSALLKIKTISWSQETGLPVTVRVRVADRSFNLHKFPLVSKSGYLKRQLDEWQEVDLPSNFPGGSETFEMIALFIYGSSTFIDPFNVASLRCAAQFLEMTEAIASNNLCERTDLYLNQVVLQSWDDTLIVLQKCQSLLPWSEDLLIVSRCIESLAFMACMEILDPERKRKKPFVSLEALVTQPWNNKLVKEVLCNQDHLWIKDLVALPFEFFKRIIDSLRRQGMKEKYVSPIIVFYANKWVLSKKTRQFWECLCDKDANDKSDDDSEKIFKTLQGILDLLQVGAKVIKVVPVGFYFSLLGRALELGGPSCEGKARLLKQIVYLLPFAHVEDFLVPKQPTESFSSSMEVGVMECIFSTFVSSHELEMEPVTAAAGNTIVAELWDSYISSSIAHDPNMTPKRFMNLVETVPLCYRNNHDHLYAAMNTYVQEHPNLSQEEKNSVCKYLNCQKLSQEVCIEAVQNELMPLRLIVQALFVQQLNTQQTFKECSESFRVAYSREFSGSLSSSRYPNSKSQNLGDHPNDDGEMLIMNNKHLSCLLENDNNANLQINQQPANNDDDEIAAARKEYESTSFRIQNLEQELASLKKNIRLKKLVKETGDDDGDGDEVGGSKMRRYGLEGRSFSKNRNNNISLGKVTSCIGSVNFSSQRKYAGRLLKIFRRVTLFGRPKLKRRPSVSHT